LNDRAANPARFATAGHAYPDANTLDQILADLNEARRLGADTVVLDPYHGDPEQTRRPAESWRALTAVATQWRTAS